MEDGLRVCPGSLIGNSRESLNPCCCGRWSQSRKTSGLYTYLGIVLILVVVEDGLRDLDKAVEMMWFHHSLNPCCCGRWSQSLERITERYSLRVGLNPCCCGRWSQSFSFLLLILSYISLNPCCCGRWSQRAKNAM